MNKRKLITTILILSVVMNVISGFTVNADDSTGSPALTATAADEWTALFDRRGQKEATWLGADGIYSVSLDGNDAFASATADTNTFFIFSDTLMGTSNSSGKVMKQEAMPAQTSALLSGNRADENALSFVYGRGGNMRLGQHLFGEHKWMLDCFVTGGSLYVLGFPEQDWKPKQIDMITLPIEDGEVNYRKFKKTANIEQLWYRDGDTYLYAYGIGVTMNTESAGAPDPDGYIYIYGYRDAMQEFSRKDMIVSRIKESDFPDFTKLTYWDGEGWCDDIQKSAIVLSAVSCEMSVTPVTVGPYTGKYIAVYTQNTQSSDIMYAIGDSPVGPFSEPVKFYHAEEHGTTGASGSGTRYVYNAKAHPHLSEGDLLLVSYNVNVMDASQYTTDYHPRFVWLDLDPENEYVREDTPDTDSGKAPSDDPSADNQPTDINDGKKNGSPLPIIIGSVGVVCAAAVAFTAGFLISRKKKQKNN